MKKFVVMSLALFSLVSFVGCAKDAEKAADKIESKVSDGDTLQTQGLAEYEEAQIYLRGIVNGQTAVNTESIDTAIAKYTHARGTFAASKASYKKALDVHADNSDQVKLYGKDSIYKAMEHVDKYIAQIDKSLKSLEDFKKKM